MKLPNGANSRLNRMILFHLVQKLGEDSCYRCGGKIETIDEFSIEHKNAWRYQADPVLAYFDLENISFSHRSCNYRAARHATKYCSDEQRITMQRALNTLSAKKRYTSEKRRARYKRYKC